MKTVYIALLINLIFVLSSCCTKKDCEFNTTPIIEIHFEETTNVSIFKADNNFEILDTIIDSRPTIIENIYINDYQLGDNSHPINYIIKSNLKHDTISQIKFLMIGDDIDCNWCFPFGDGSAYQENFSNLEFRVNDSIIYNQTNITL